MLEAQTIQQNVKGETMNKMQYESVLEILRNYKGPDNMLAARNLCVSVGISQRELRAIVASMRANGELIVGNTKGYFLASSWDEYAKFVSPQVKNNVTYLKQYNELKKKYTGVNEDQIELTLNIYDNHKNGVKMQHKKFTYQKPSNGEISEREVLVIKEGDDYIEGIDIGRLSISEKAALESANAVIELLTKQKHYRKFLKKGIK